jgi:hypothetical protein
LVLNSVRLLVQTLESPSLELTLVPTSVLRWEMNWAPLMALTTVQQ